MHLPSLFNIFLVLVPLMPTLELALLFLMLCFGLLTNGRAGAHIGT